MSIQKIGSTWVLRLNSGVDLSGASPLAITYKDPAGNEGSLTTSVYNTTWAQAEITSLIGITKGAWSFEINATIGGKLYISYETFRVSLTGRYT